MLASVLAEGEVWGCSLTHWSPPAQDHVSFVASILVLLPHDVSSSENMAITDCRNEVPLIPR
jgi:hypothetical protein